MFDGFFCLLDGARLPFVNARLSIVIHVKHKRAIIETWQSQGQDCRESKRFCQASRA